MVFLYFCYQAYFNIWKLTLIEKYDNREWRIPYHFYWEIWSDSKIAQKQLDSYWYFWEFHSSLNPFGELASKYVFFESGSTIKIVSKWHEYRKSSGFMDEWSNLNIYLLEDSSWKYWTTNDFTIDDPYGYGDPLERDVSEYMLFEALYRFKELYILVTYTPLSGSGNIKEVIQNTLPRGTYHLIDNPLFNNNLKHSKQDTVIHINTYQELIQIITSNVLSTGKYFWYLNFSPLSLSWGILSEFTPK